MTMIISEWGWLLLFVRDLNVAIWLGGLITIDCIEAPARFRTSELNRDQIAAVGRQVFAAFNRAEILMGVTLMTVSILLLLRAEGGGFLDVLSGWMTLACIGLMALIAMIQFLKLRPRMDGDGDCSPGFLVDGAGFVKPARIR